MLWVTIRGNELGIGVRNMGIVKVKELGLGLGVRVSGKGKCNSVVFAFFLNLFISQYIDRISYSFEQI